MGAIKRRRPEPIVKPIQLGLFTLNAQGLTVKGTPTFEDYCEVGAFAGHTHQASGWWLVDWLTYGEGREDWAEQMDQAISLTGLAEQTLVNIRTARRIAPERRRPELGLDKHLEVAKLTPAEQEEWLDRCATFQWSRRELRDELRAARRRRIVEGQASLTGMYRVVYADPPWAYDDDGDTAQGGYGKAESHYPTMTIDQLCALPVQAHVLPNAVLFLWVTVPMLLQNPGPREVIEAWGFDYKTNFVWDKVHGMVGHYSMVNHEHLLLCTRGSCPLDAPNPRPDSVFTERREGPHSSKPTAIRLMITRLYTTGPYVELFGREPVEGWDVFGNDARLWEGHHAPR